jgi:hypothetical protein
MEHLRKVVASLPDLPKNVKLQGVTAEFEMAMTKLLDSIKPGLVTMGRPAPIASP